MAPRRSNLDRLARRMVQLGFLGLFLYPLVPLVVQRLSLKAAPTLSSWLLPWDPLVALVNLMHGRWSVLIIGAPLLLLALTAVFGRFFCGWVCPLGTVLDLVSGLAFWRKKRFVKREPARRNSPVRYYLLLFLVTAGIFSLKILGIFDPLVIFQRLSAALTHNLLELARPAAQMSLAVISLVFIAILVLELWRPRFWCRHLCPLGAALSLPARFTLFKRKVEPSCSGCSACVRACPMNAIPADETRTDYSDCTFCLECQPACPKKGISFGFGAGSSGLAPVSPTRRQFLQGAGIAAAGLALAPLSQLAPERKVLRPPGALPGKEFVQTCILCQECVRVCPTGGLRSLFLEGGLAAIGTPTLVPRLGGCALNPSCPNLCARVCPVGAIQPTLPADLKLGLAEVDRSLCLAWDQEVKCLVCVEACLVEAAKIYQGRVVVDAAKCTGCGRCEAGCPVAGSAIRVKPL